MRNDVVLYRVKGDQEYPIYNKQKGILFELVFLRKISLVKRNFKGKFQCSGRGKNALTLILLMWRIS
jgi:hypothetical protein